MSSVGMALDIEQQVEAEDGVVEVPRVLPHLTFSWACVPAGPRRWAPTDLAVEADGEVLLSARMTYRTVGDRVVVVAGARPEVDVDGLAGRLATPLLFARHHHRRTGQGLTPAAIMSASRGEPIWDAGDAREGWAWGHAGVGDRPVRLAHRVLPTGHLLLAAHGVAAEEVATLVGTLQDLAEAGRVAEDLHMRHRRALAQRWWDAPRVPWTPSDRTG